MYKLYRKWQLTYKLANKNNATTRIINGEEEILLAGLILLLLGAVGGAVIIGFEVVVVVATGLRSQGVPSVIQIKTLENVLKPTATLIIFIIQYKLLFIFEIK